MLTQQHNSTQMKDYGFFLFRRSVDLLFHLHLIDKLFFLEYLVD